MSLVDHLMATRTKLELAKELFQTAKENQELKDRAGAAELELFWIKAVERNLTTVAIGETNV